MFVMRPWDGCIGAWCLRLDQIGSLLQQRLVLKYGQSKIPIWLRTDSWRWGASLLSLFYFESPLFNGLQGCTLLCIGQTGYFISLLQNRALTFCFLTTCLLVFATFFFFDSSTMSVRFFLSLSFTLGSKRILTEVNYG